jgi:hypothetical protein
MGTTSACCRSRNDVPSAAMKRTKPSDLPEIHDEPGTAERFQRGLRNLLNTPPQHPTKPTKPKERSESKGRVHKDKIRD